MRRSSSGPDEEIELWLPSQALVPGASQVSGGYSKIVARLRPGVTSLELVIGMAAAAAARGLSSLLYRVSPYDATTFAAAVAVVGGGAMLMTYLAAWRARTIDPIVVLKQE